MPNLALTTLYPQDNDSDLLLKQRAGAALAALAGQPALVAIGSVTTSATGANFATLSAADCNSVTIINQSGADIEVRRGGAGAAITVPDSAGYEFEGLTNANQLSLRRVDQSNTQVTVSYETKKL